MKLRSLLKNWEEIVSSVFMIIVMTLTIVNVLLRIIFRGVIVWAEEAVTIAFVWCSFTGALACYKHRTHMGVDIIVNMLSSKARVVVDLIINVLIFALNAYVAYLSVFLCIGSVQKTSPVLRLPYPFVNASLLLSFGGMAIYSILFIAKDVKKLLGKAPLEDTTGEEAQNVPEVRL